MKIDYFVANLRNQHPNEHVNLCAHHFANFHPQFSFDEPTHHTPLYKLTPTPTHNLISKGSNWLGVTLKKFQRELIIID